MKKEKYPYPMLLLELLPENKEALEKILNHLHNRGWTLDRGVSILEYIPYEEDDRIFIYNDKTVRVGNLTSARFWKPKMTILVDKEKVVEGLAGPRYEKWMKDFAKEVEKSFMERVIC